MSTESAAPELAPAEEATDTDAMGAIWDRLNAEEAPEPADDKAAPEPVADGETDEGEAAADGHDAADDQAAEGGDDAADAEPVEAAPADLPKALRDHWKDIPKEAREAFTERHRDLSNRYREARRVEQAAKPTYDVLVEAVQKLPTLKAMKPEDVARDVFKMAQVQDALVRDPVQTILKIAQDYGAFEALQETFRSGQIQRAQGRRPQDAPNPADIERLVERRAAAIVEQQLAQREGRSIIEEFTSRPHWKAVEPAIPAMIDVARMQLGENASHKALLGQAYEMAVRSMNLAAEEPASATKPEPVSDPEKVQQQARARSVNVRSTKTGNPKPLTERQAMELVWERAMNK